MSVKKGIVTWCFVIKLHFCDKANYARFISAFNSLSVKPAKCHRQRFYSDINNGSEKGREKAHENY